MALTQASTLVSFDADAALAAVRDQVGEGLLAGVEFTTDDHRTLYAADVVVELYGDEAAMLDHFEEIHRYVHVDFTERELFEDVVGGGDVRAMVTYMDHATLVRVIDEREGLFVTVAPDAEVTAVVEAVEAELG